MKITPIFHSFLSGCSAEDDPLRPSGGPPLSQYKASTSRQSPLSREILHGVQAAGNWSAEDDPPNVLSESSFQRL